MCIKLWDNFNLHSCVAPEGFENSVCGPRPKKSVHHWATQCILEMLLSYLYIPHSSARCSGSQKLGHHKWDTVPRCLVDGLTRSTCVCHRPAPHRQPLTHSSSVAAAASHRLIYTNCPSLLLWMTMVVIHQSFGIWLMCLRSWMLMSKASAWWTDDHHIPMSTLSTSSLLTSFYWLLLPSAAAAAAVVMETRGFSLSKIQHYYTNTCTYTLSKSK